jgi:hypothetical protein
VLDHPLDNPVWSALTGPQSALGERSGRAVRYLPDISPFAALPSGAGDADWAALGELAGPAAGVVLTWRGDLTPPPGWEQVESLDGVQMDGSGLDVRPDPEAVVLGEADVPEMLDLVARTRPGPFLPRTRVMGTYLGMRRGGALVAMAGERMRRPAGPRSAPSAPTPPTAGRASRPGSSGPSGR